MLRCNTRHTGKGGEVKTVLVAISKGGAGKTMLAKSMARVANWQVTLCDDCGLDVHVHEAVCNSEIIGGELSPRWASLLVCFRVGGAHVQMTGLAHLQHCRCADMQVSGRASVHNKAGCCDVITPHKGKGGGMKAVVVEFNKGGARKTMLAKSMARVANWQVALCDDCGETSSSTSGSANVNHSELGAHWG
jgi:hypothetical protein